MVRSFGASQQRGNHKRLISLNFFFGQALTDMPERFPLVPNYEGSGLHRRVHENYLIFYRIGAKTIEVIHGAMDYERLLFPHG
jgi:plasmid stabilization system protein ParE